MGWFLLIGALAVTFVVYCCLIVGSDSFQDRRKEACGRRRAEKYRNPSPAGDGFSVSSFDVIASGTRFSGGALQCTALPREARNSEAASG